MSLIADTHLDLTLVCQTTDASNQNSAFAPCDPRPTAATTLASIQPNNNNSLFLRIPKLTLSSQARDVSSETSASAPIDPQLIAITALTASQHNQSNSLFLTKLPAEMSCESYRLVFRQEARIKVNKFRLNCDCPRVHYRRCNCTVQRSERNLVETEGSINLLLVCKDVNKEASPVFLHAAEWICCGGPLMPAPIRFRRVAETTLKELTISYQNARGSPAWNFTEFKALRVVHWLMGDVCLPAPGANHQSLTDQTILRAFGALHRPWLYELPAKTTVTGIFNLAVFEQEQDSAQYKWRYKCQFLPCRYDRRTKVLTRRTNEAVEDRYRSTADRQQTGNQYMESYSKKRMKELWGHAIQ